MGCALSGTAHVRVRTHTHSYTHVRMQTSALCIIVSALLLPVCDPPHLGSLATGGPTMWAGDELLMAATWHCHVAFSMTVASVSMFLCVVRTWCVCNERSKRLPLRLTNDTSVCFLSKVCFSSEAQMWADAGSVMGAAAAVSLTKAKIKLGGLVRH